jgi:hypothetical protein
LLSGQLLFRAVAPLSEVKWNRWWYERAFNSLRKLRILVVNNSLSGNLQPLSFPEKSAIILLVWDICRIFVDRAN